MSSGPPAAAPHHCPVCGEEFPVAVAELRFQRHVNRCIDGLPDDEPLFPSGSTAAMMMKLLPPMSNHSGAADGDGLGGRAIPNSESQVSLESSDSSPLFSAKHAGGVGGSSSSVSSQPLRPPGSAAEFPHCASSSDFYAAIAESVEFICGLCPDFPRALVEEVLAATGNNRELALGVLFDMKDAYDDVGQQQQQPEDGSSPAPRSRGGGSSVGMHRAVSLHNFGITSHFSKATIGHHHKPAPHRAAAAVPPPPPPKSSLVELVVYDLQPDSKMAKKVGLGVYHSGVVVYKHEFSFGGTRNPKRDSGKPGIWATRHLYTTAPVVKKRVVLGETFYTPKEIEAIIKEWGSTEWRVDDYHLLSKNCNHFADAFLQRLADKSVAAAAAAPTETPTSAKGSVSSATMIDVPFSPPQSQSAEPSAAKPTTSSGGPASQTNVPSGVTPLPKFAPPPPPPVAGSAEQSPAAPMMMSPSSSAFSASCPTFPLPPDELRRAKEVFRLPSWVNRAASLGSAVIPDFLFKRIVEALMPPVPEDEEEGGSESAAEATPTSAIPPRNGSQPPISDSSGAAHVSVRAVNNEDVQTLKDVLGLTDDGEASGLLQLAGGDLSRAILLATSKR